MCERKLLAGGGEGNEMYLSWYIYNRGDRGKRLK